MANNSTEFFGFEFRQKKNDEEKQVSFIPQTPDDGALLVTPVGGYTGGAISEAESASRNEVELINKYRALSEQPEMDMAIDEIVNEVISITDDDEPVKLNTDRLEEIGVSKKTKEMISEEFKEILRMLDFYDNGYEVFRRWYIDGRIYYHVVITEGKTEEGIQDLRYVDPRKIRKIRELKTNRNAVSTEMLITNQQREYFIYSERGFNYTSKNGYTPNSMNALKISKDSIAHVTSGLLDHTGTMVISYLHKAIKPMNQLRVLEDAAIIYRLARAPERRVWYIDVGNLPTVKAEQYVQNIMVKHKNKLVYDATSGEIRDSRHFMTMLEDYWLPRREGGMGTSVTTLPGAQQLGEMTDIEYFKQKLYKSLNVPVSRLESEGGFNLGRASEISRDEVKFNKFIVRLRARFNKLFLELLKKQLILKKIILLEDWEKFETRIKFDYVKDNFFSEARDQEIMMNRLNLALQMEPFRNKFFSNKYIQKKIFKHTDEEIEEMREEIVEEQDDEIYNPPLNMGMGMGTDPNQDPNAQQSNPDDKPLFPDEK